MALKLIRSVQWALAMVLLLVTWLRLGNMEIEGVPTFAGLMLGLMFGFTSLMYNRARTYPAGATQVQSVFAAEHGLHATVSFAMGSLLYATIFLGLNELGFRPILGLHGLSRHVPTFGELIQPVPALGAFLPIGFFIYSFMHITWALEALLLDFEWPSLPRVLNRMEPRSWPIPPQSSSDLSASRASEETPSE